MDPYKPLTLRYRPRRWGDLVGQEVTARTIVNMLAQNRLMQTIIFGGSRGIGKTTAARILARALNCERVDKKTYEPCGECQICQDITAERSLSVQEMDAASNGLVDDVRRIKEEVQYADTGKCRVYIIDECHSLSRQAWDAFLKLLEEPPPNVVFVFCTTEVHRIPETIISRSAHFSFARMKIEHIVQRLQHIVDQEGYQLEAGVLPYIAKHVNGGMRDAVGMLDQLVSFTDGKTITKDSVMQVVGVVSVGLMFDLYRAFVAADLHRLYQLLQQAYTQVSDVSVLIGDLTLFYRDLMLAKVGVPIPDAQPDYLGALQQAAASVTVDYLIDAQSNLHFINDQLRRSRLPARSVVDVYITKLLYGGVRQSVIPTPQPAPVQLAVPMPLLDPDAVASSLEGRIVAM